MPQAARGRALTRAGPFGESRSQSLPLYYYKAYLRAFPPNHWAVVCLSVCRSVLTAAAHAVHGLVAMAFVAMVVLPWRPLSCACCCGRPLLDILD